MTNAAGSRFISFFLTSSDGGFVPKNWVLGWVNDVESAGLSEVRKVLGYHDEPLKGNRVGQRSIRLSKSYRAIYINRSGRQN
jgi:proteic killer suppression protein